MSDVGSPDAVLLPPEFASKRLLVVDDEEANLMLLEGILRRGGYTAIELLDDPRQLVARFVADPPDMLLLDHRMPHLTGLEVLEALAPHLPEGFPVVMITADDRPELRHQALASGARDFLTKPVQSVEVLLRVRNLLEAWTARAWLAEQNELLERRVRDRTADLERSQMEMLVRLARAAEYRDDASGEHVWRVARTSALLADALGEPADRVEALLRAARLHDVGKIGIPDGILLKPGRLSAAEFEVVKTHCAIGYELLSGSRSPLVQLAAEIALTHHERWDGQGYPSRLSGRTIPLAARVLAVADAFDAVTHDRAHRRGRSPEEAIAEIEQGRGTQFDPEAVDALVALFEAGELASDGPLG
ncbi:MAG: response regulator [Trueperaceae bacterium]|nr:response regulator [Trueperaceae bacterium]